VELFTFERSIARKESCGATGPQAVAKQLAYAKSKLNI
jgi:hypothetical protein